MPCFHLIFLILVLLSWSLGSDSWCPHDYARHKNREFEQKTDRFWEFQEQSNTWVEVKLPYDLVSCVNDNCTKVETESLKRKVGDGETEEISEVALPLRKRISLTKMSESSIWVTGESGSIYERFWNGIQWVIAPHDLQVLTGHAICVFIVNQTILTLSEAGTCIRYYSQPIWVEFTPTLDESTNREAEQSSLKLINSGVISHDGLKIYFCTKNGSLLELSEAEPPRWENHGRPPGADVAAIVDAATARPDVVYTISSTGDLYEYDRSSKPAWKKHIWAEGTEADASLMPSMGCTLHGLSGEYSISLFLLTKGGKLVERRLNQRKWKWIVHGSPKDHKLTSITPVVQDETNEKFLSLFLTTSSGSVFEYRILKQSGTDQENQIPEAWLSHMHPPHAKVASGIAGLPLQAGRIVFPLHDGRLAELHLPGLGGENTGPNLKYAWSMLDAPETEGWNAEYCREERGAMNCIEGIKDEPNEQEITRSMARRRKGSKTQQDYLFAGSNGPNKQIIFLVTDDGFTYEHLYAENLWLWLRHDHSTPMTGALGNYNGSLFLVDIYGSLLMRERNGEGLTWVNCTAMRNLGLVIGGPPWDGIPDRTPKVTEEDAIFLVSKDGRLLQFTVALRKFKWKDCRNPPDTKVASIVDQELFRNNIVFITGRNGRLYQYNKVTELWHEHYQSQHLVLSRSPGTAMRPSSFSLTGSLFMLSEDGGLVEYHWNAGDGWNWIEHGTPNKGSDGKVYVRYIDKMTWRWKNCGFPHVGQEGGNDDDEEVCMDEDFAASLENVAAKYSDFNRNCDPKVAPTRPIPFSDDSVIFELKDGRVRSTYSFAVSDFYQFPAFLTTNSLEMFFKRLKLEIYFLSTINVLKFCFFANLKHSFKLAEMRRVEGTHWVWSRTIGTPTTSCMANYWTDVTS
ncbi:hypothetical protein IMY05_001G0151300 [Salix suchowensis]|nr:hypothetical protein IMY05_001G0151300 [Salix suchowensis]